MRVPAAFVSASAAYEAARETEGTQSKPAWFGHCSNGDLAYQNSTAAGWYRCIGHIRKLKAVKLTDWKIVGGCKIGEDQERSQGVALAKNFRINEISGARDSNVLPTQVQSVRRACLCVGPDQNIPLRGRIF